MKKNSQTNAASTDIALPDAVTVAVGELADTVREGLLAMAVGAGLQVMHVNAGERHSRVRGQASPRCGALCCTSRQRGRFGDAGGRRVPIRRPRTRSSDGGTEVGVAAYDPFASTELLGEMALERMMARLSTRRYSAGLEPVGTKVEAGARSTSKSAVSRRFVARTESALADMLAGDLSKRDLVCPPGGG